MRVTIENYAYFADFLTWVDGIPVSDKIEAIFEEFSIAPYTPASLLKALTNVFSFRRVGVCAGLPHAQDTAGREDQRRAVDIWLAMLRAVMRRHVEPLMKIKSAYETALVGGISDDGREETRTVYAAPNGTPDTAYATGMETYSVKGEYGTALDRLEKVPNIQSFDELLLSAFEPLFLGVL